MAKYKTEQERIRYIKEFSRGATPTAVRKEIGKVWGLKKTARNNKFRKLFEKSPIQVVEAQKWGVAGEKLKGGDLVCNGEDGKIYKCLGGKKVASPQVNIKGDKATVEVKESKVIYTLDELVKVCGINLEEWNVAKFTANSYGDNFQAKAEFVKKKDEKNFQKLLEKFVEEADNFAPEKFNYETPSKDRDCLYVLNIQDLHLSKLAWAKETGNSYDIDIAKEVFTNAVNDLMKKAPKERIEEVIVICGSDFFQCDKEGTTAAGTFVDTDSRLAKSFEEGINLLTTTIERLAQNFKVRVMCYPGNHDVTLSLYAGYYVSAWFKNNSNVVVDNAPKSRKYYGYGKTLLCFVHGNEEKPADLPLIIMREQMAEVSKYKYIECLSGHFHAEATTEKNGVKLRTASSLSGEDGWHTKKGFVSNIRTSQGLLYSKEQGIEAIYYSNPV